MKQDTNKLLLVAITIFSLLELFCIQNGFSQIAGFRESMLSSILSWSFAFGVSSILTYTTIQIPRYLKEGKIIALSLTFIIFSVLAIIFETQTFFSLINHNITNEFNIFSSLLDNKSNNNTRISISIFLSVILTFPMYFLVLISNYKNPKIINLNLGKNFSDIDNEIYNKNKTTKINEENEKEIKNLISNLSEQKEIEINSDLKIDLELIRVLTNQIGALKNDNLKLQESISNLRDEYKTSNFQNYFNTVINNLQQEIELSNKKSSLLLSRAILISVFGIVYYLISIIVFQTYFTSKGFNNYNIYGIVSSSLLFLFIEFIGAWFLKQYKYFVDISTFYFKIKTMIDKYILIYHAANEMTLNGNKDAAFDKLYNFLSQDFKFPESYFLKEQETNLTKETLETLIKSLSETLKTVSELKKTS